MGERGLDGKVGESWDGSGMPTLATGVKRRKKNPERRGSSVVVARLCSGAVEGSTQSKWLSRLGGMAGAAII